MTQLVVLLSQKEGIRVNQLKPRIRAWCETFGGHGSIINDIQYAVTAASDTPSIERALVVILNMIVFARRDGGISDKAVKELRKIHDALERCRGRMIATRWAR